MLSSDRAPHDTRSGRLRLRLGTNLHMDPRQQRTRGVDALADDVAACFQLDLDSHAVLLQGDVFAHGRKIARMRDIKNALPDPGAVEPRHSCIIGLGDTCRLLDDLAAYYELARLDSQANARIGNRRVFGVDDVHDDLRSTLDQQRDPSNTLCADANGLHTRRAEPVHLGKDPVATGGDVLEEELALVVGPRLQPLRTFIRLTQHPHHGSAVEFRRIGHQTANPQLVM